MAVSYLSQTYKSNPYVLPLDLGIFDKVMATKQRAFELGAAKQQQQVDQMGMLDVMKGEDREYLNAKINNLVNSVNSFGGVDYSDIAIQNQLQGLGSDIYTDEKVTTAISSTKSARNLITSYEKFKSDPKLRKSYSQVNEDYDLSKVSAWLNDGQLGSAYKGPTAATPYVAYRDNHMKMFEKMKADLVESIDDKGLYILKESHERVTPERLMAQAADLLLPEERMQMKRDAWHLYTVQGGLSPADVIGKSMEDFKVKLSQEQGILSDYENQAKAASSDPKESERYQKLANQQRQKVSSLKVSEKDLVNSAVKKYKEDPEEYMYQTYSNDYFRGLANRFSVNRTQRSIQFDQAEMFTKKMAQEDFQFGENIKLKKKELEIAQQRADTEMAKAYMHIDPETGKVTSIKPQDVQLTSTNINTQDPDGLVVSEDALKVSNNQLLLEKDRVSQDFINELIGQRPDLGLAVADQAGTGVTRQLLGQQYLENVNGKAGFQIEDLAGIESKATQGQLRQSGMSVSQIDYLKTIYSNFRAMTQGKAGTVPDLPEGFFEKVVERNKMIDERIRANTEKVNSVNNAVAVQAGLTTGESVMYNDYLAHPDKYRKETYNQRGDFNGFTVSDNITNIENKMKESNVDFKKLKADYYKAISTRDVFRTRTFQDDDSFVKDGQLQKIVADNIAAGRGTAMMGSQKVPMNTVSVNDITPISMGMAADGSGKYYVMAEVKRGSGEKQSTSMYRIDIDDANASKMGLNRDPYEGLNYSVNLTGRSGDLPIYGTKDLSVVVNIVKKNTNDPNNYESFAQAKIYHLDAQGNIAGQTLVKVPASDGKVPSEAYALVKQAVTEASKKGITYDQFKEYLYNYKK